jgi:hypothetical protein
MRYAFDFNRIDLAIGSLGENTLKETPNNHDEN